MLEERNPLKLAFKLIVPLYTESLYKPILILSPANTCVCVC